MHMLMPATETNNNRRVVKPPSRGAGYQRAKEIREHFKLAYGPWYARHLRYMLKMHSATIVARSTLLNWFAVGHLAPVNEKAILIHVDETMKHLQAIKDKIEPFLREYDRQPKRRTGCFEVKNHGDGLGLHDSRFQTLHALGLRKRADVSKR
jgi:hypothetical protein